MVEALDIIIDRRPKKRTRDRMGPYI